MSPRVMPRGEPVEIFRDLPGPFYLEVGHYRDGAALMVSQIDRLGRPWRAGWAHVDEDALEDLLRVAERLEAFLESTLDHVFRPWKRPDDPGFLDGFDPVPKASLWLARARFLRRLARDPRARGNLADDAAFLAARRLRRAADRLDALFEERRGHWRRP